MLNILYGIKHSKTTFVTVNLLLGIGYLLTYMHSKTTFVTVNPIITIIFIINNHNSKTTFVTVNQHSFRRMSTAF